MRVSNCLRWWLIAIPVFIVCPFLLVGFGIALMCGDRPWRDYDPKEGFFGGGDDTIGF